MGRLFRRGELGQAIAVVLDSIGEAHGYAIMGELKDRVGGDWKPSPGAIYPALLKLADRGLVSVFDVDDTRFYTLTAEGREFARAAAASGRWATLTERSAQNEQRRTVGYLLDDFAARNPWRRRVSTPDQQLQIEKILQHTNEDIELLLGADGQGDDNG